MHFWRKFRARVAFFQSGLNPGDPGVLYSNIIIVGLGLISNKYNMYSAIRS